MVTRFDDQGDNVTVTTEDGRSFEGGVLIGADGIRSRIRAQLFNDGDPRPNGFMGFRTIVPMGDVTADIQRDIVALWGGPVSTSFTTRSVKAHCSISWRCSEGRPIPSVATWWLIVRSLSTPTATRIRR